MDIPELGNVNNVVFNAGTNIGKKMGLIKEPWYMYYLKILGVLLILSFIGINLFTYLSEGIDAITYFLRKISNPIIKPISEVTRPITSPIKKGIEKTADLTKTTLKELSADLEKKGDETDDEPEPDSDQLSEIQKNRKTGWCLIGTDKGYRSCMKINEMDECLSGKVYRTEAVCNNPDLRP